MDVRLFTPTPPRPVFWNHGVRRELLECSLILKDLRVKYFRMCELAA